MIIITTNAMLSYSMVSYMIFCHARAQARPDVLPFPARVEVLRLGVASALLLLSLF